MSIKRHLKQNIIESLDYSPVVLINGARQSGKSTFAKELIAEGKLVSYITLDNPLVLNNLTKSPIAFLEDLPVGTVIDEIQRAPEVFTSIKYVIDKNRVKGRFLLTGSANILLLPKLSDSLTGRIAIHTLHPFSQGEICNKKEDFVDWLFSDDFQWFKVANELSGNQLEEIIAKGSYPEPITEKFSENLQNKWYNDYLNTLLIRDVRDLANIDQINLMPQLLSLLGSRNANLFNLSDISRSLDIPQTSLKRYVNLLQSLYLVDFLKPWYTNFGKRLVKSPKVFLSDTGFSLYLLGKNQASLHDNRILFGQFLENFIFLEIQKQLGWSKTIASMYHYRTSAGEEIDLVLEDRRGKLVAIEVKSTSSIDQKDIQNIRNFRDVVGDKFHRGIVFYTGQEIHRIDQYLYIIPIQTLWEERLPL